jgi:hypothetical protein
MRHVFLIVICSILLASCQPGVDTYSGNPNKRIANIDEHAISVVAEGGDIYVAWGGEEDRDGFVQYRQKRAIELVSHCRVSSVLSKKGDPVLRAKVKCS